MALTGDTPERTAANKTGFVGDIPGRLPNLYSNTLGPSHFEGWEAVEVARSIMAHHDIRDFVSSYNAASRPLTRVIPIAEKLLDRCKNDVEKAKRLADSPDVAREMLRAGFAINKRG